MSRYRSGVAIASMLALAAIMTAPVAAQDDATSDAAVEVTGIEYAFEGLAGELVTGTDLTFVNGGAEVHELAVARVADGVTESVEELLAMGDAAIESGKVVLVGERPLFAGPGEAAFGTVDIDLPGTYVAVCFIPQGLTDPSVFELLGPGSDPEALPDDIKAMLENPPHVALGMLAVFTVTGEAMVDADAMDDADEMDDAEAADAAYG